MKVNYCPICSRRMEVEHPPALFDVCFCFLKCPGCGLETLLSDSQAASLAIESTHKFPFNPIEEIK